ncbi:MAG: magnesium transporter, partial [Erysipelothrix sp.]|nr:magnesium transporter [Erysipelothrix sp.]
ITGMGGNAGTQTLTLICRSIALGEIDKSNSLSTLFKEIISGIFNGLVVGLLVGTVGYGLSKNIWIGVIVGGSMLINMVVAVIAGFGIPLFLNKIKVDPAVASAVFVTTFTDAVGFTVFLGLATVFIEKLV